MDFFGLQLEERIRSVLLELEKVKSDGGSFWNVPRSTGVFLNSLVRALDAKRVLEIGTSNGYSGVFFAEALLHTGGKLYTIESHAKRFLMARENFERAGVTDVIVQIKGHAPEIIVEKFFDEKGRVVLEGESAFGGNARGGGSDVVLEGEVKVAPVVAVEAEVEEQASLALEVEAAPPFDLVFMDATKMEYESYLNVVFNLVRRGGLIVADNCLSHSESVAPFIEAALKNESLETFLLPMDSGLFFARIV